MTCQPRFLFVLLLLLLGWGCTRKLETPQFDAQAISARAMTDYDLNKDGFLDAKELERCPGLKSCLKRLDRDGDGRLSRAELEEGLAAYGESRLALVEVMCKVTLGGQPLAGASVVLEPESFMGESIKPARGTTNEQGQARMQADDAPQPGCHLGIYRVRISKIDNNGPDTVPARYNTQTQLGIEVGPGTKAPYVFRLTPAR